MNWINIKDKLPPLRRYVLIHIINKEWFDNDDSPFFRVAKLLESKTEDKQNFLFWEFWNKDLYGKDIYGLDQVDYWCEIDRNLH